jgi:NADPH:quinone reductase-like Zn-dependent oxidoreductase
MKAIAWTAYGAPDVLQLEEADQPVPKDNEVLIRVAATTVTAGDCEVRSFKVANFIWLPMRLYLGLRKPRKNVIGQEFAGDVEAVGKDVRHFKPGDAVFGSTGLEPGTYAEYICLPEAGEDGVMEHKPTNLSYAEAAGVPTGGLEALKFLGKANIQRGERVLINGAGGSIGTFAVQIARQYGAEVTAVDSGAKLGLLRSLGADHVMDYTREDFTRSGQSYDVIFDVVGKSPFARSLRALRPGGRYLLANPRLSLFARGWWASRTTDKRVIMGLAGDQSAHLRFLKEQVEAGTLKSVVDRCFPLERTADAHRYVETGQKQGHVIITVGDQG